MISHLSDRFYQNSIQHPSLGVSWDPLIGKTTDDTITASEWPSKVAEWRKALDDLSTKQPKIQTIDDLIPRLFTLLTIESDAYTAAQALTTKAISIPETGLPVVDLDAGFQTAVKFTQEWLEKTVQAVGIEAP